MGLTFIPLEEIQKGLKDKMQRDWEELNDQDKEMIKRRFRPLNEQLSNFALWGDMKKGSLDKVLLNKLVVKDIIYFDRMSGYTINNSLVVENLFPDFKQ